jgi:hypothetical protein
VGIFTHFGGLAAKNQRDALVGHIMRRVAGVLTSRTKENIGNIQICSGVLLLFPRVTIWGKIQASLDLLRSLVAAGPPYSIAGDHPHKIGTTLKVGIIRDTVASAEEGGVGVVKLDGGRCHSLSFLHL